MVLAGILVLLALSLLPGSAIGSAIAGPAAADYGSPQPLEDTPHTRKYFYAGGKYVSDGAGANIVRDQIFVEHLIPVGGPKKKYPLVFIHGQAQTGTVCANHAQSHA